MGHYVAIVKFDHAYTTHAAMVGAGGVMQLFGTAVMLCNPSSKKNVIMGSVASLIGAGLIAASFFPLPKGIRVDERGLVIDIQKK